MTRFRVRGADKASGRDVEKFYETASREEARQRAKADGILVETIDAVPVPKRTASPMVIVDDNVPADELVSFDAQVSPPAPAVKPDAVDYRSPSTAPVAVPRYAGLAIAGRVISVFAVLYYLVALVVIGVIIWGVATRPAGFRWTPAEGVTALIFPLSAAMIGGLLHGASTACFALRDIARNSWR